jgi:hypothetical protein
MTSQYITRAEKNIANAMQMMADGFSSKAAKKRVTDMLGRAYDSVRDAVHAHFLNVPYDVRTQEQTDVYYDIPNQLNHWRDRHAEAVLKMFPEAEREIDLINELVGLRAEVMATEIVAPEVAAKPERVVRVEKLLSEIIEQRQQQYLRGIYLGELFNGLSVYANTHMVVNSHGTQFVRSFYYLFGKLTPLNVICAAAEELARRKEAEIV